MRRLLIMVSMASVAALLLAGCGAVGVLSTEEYLDNIRLSGVELDALEPGLYEGSYTISTPPGVMVANRTARVRVLVETDGDRRRIAEITYLEPEQFAQDAAFLRLADRVIAAGDVRVDRVSGASYSGVAVLKAIEGALSNR